MGSVCGAQVISVIVSLENFLPHPAHFQFSVCSILSAPAAFRACRDTGRLCTFWLFAVVARSARLSPVPLVSLTLTHVQQVSLQAAGSVFAAKPSMGSKSSSTSKGRRSMTSAENKAQPCSVTQTRVWRSPRDEAVSVCPNRQCVVATPAV